MGPGVAGRARRPGSAHVYNACLIASLVVVSVAKVTWPGAQEELVGNDVRVTTNYGILRGTRRDADMTAGGEADVRHVDWFIGVPFAAPPVGKLRFKPPRPPAAWEGIREAKRFSHVCPQAFQYADFSSGEDCLYVNIYSPVKSLNGTEKLPVMVYIHGGSYRIGTGATFLGHILAQYGVVVVTINYRLSLLGFLSSRPDPALPGNNGILDQIRALHWIRENIDHFRGDPDRVTIFGCSAGGASVGILIASPIAKGLFRQAIVQSGSPMAFWAVHNDTVDLAAYVRKMAGLVDCQQDQMADIADCLRESSAQKLSEFEPDHIPRISAAYTEFRPHAGDHVLPSMPRDMLRDGHVNVEAVMTGMVEDEWASHMGMMLSDLERRQGVVDFNKGISSEEFEDFVRHVTSRLNWPPAIADVILHQYTNWTNALDRIETRGQYIKLMTDLTMLAPTEDLATLVHGHHVPVFLYKFHHVSQTEAANWRTRLYHGQELYFVFGAPFYQLEIIYARGEKTFTEEDRAMSRYVMSLWSDFGKHGDPSFSTESTAKWGEYNPQSADYLELSLNQTRMRRNVRKDKVAFWNHVVPTLRAQLQRLPQEEAEAKVSDYRDQVWILTAFCCLLLVLSIVFGAVLFRNYACETGPRPGTRPVTV